MEALWSRARHWLLDLNLFTSGSNDTEILQEERWSTRLYLILMLVSLLVLVSYTALGARIVNETVENPSHTVFEKLQQTYSRTLKCPCSQISIEYQAFFQLKPIFHQICSSAFITDNWILAAYQIRKPYFWAVDARNFLSAHAQILRMLCVHSQLILDDVWKSKLSAPLVTSDALPLELLEQQVGNLLNLIRQQGPWQVGLILIVSRMSINSNQGVSGLGTNAFAYVAKDGLMKVAVHGYETANSTCYCLPAKECTAQAALYSETEGISMPFGTYSTLLNSSTPIKGMKTACFPVESVLSSTLECYADASCLELLIPNSNATPLDLTQPTRFPIANSTIGDIFNEIMVEEWRYSFSWLGYYAKCAPKRCSYSYSTRNGILIVMTSITALFGGLNTVFRVTVPFTVTTTIRWWKRRRMSTNETSIAGESKF